MKPLFHSSLVNGASGDPVLFLDFLFEKRALLLDAGDIRRLAPRKLLRVSDAFVTHAHMDHFADFDWLVRICLGRDKRIRLFGPPGFIDRVEHKLAAYTWNLVDKYDADLTFVVTELLPGDAGRRATFRCRARFEREDEAAIGIPGGWLLDESALRVRGMLLDHAVPCLAVAVEESRHVNIWKNRLAELDLPVGAWLRELKQAVLEGRPEDELIRAWWKEDGKTVERFLPLGHLADEVVRVVPGQKLGYVVDASFSEDNVARMVDLLRDADVLFIEAPFLDEDGEMAAAKRHLTARQAGLVGRMAGVGRIVPFHFSPRYPDAERALRREAQDAFHDRARAGHS